MPDVPVLLIEPRPEDDVAGNGGDSDVKADVMWVWPPGISIIQSPKRS
jgi:hypothetical protein